MTPFLPPLPASLLGALLLAGPLGQDPEPAPEPAPTGPRIGVLYWSMDIPGQVAMRRGLELEFERVRDERELAEAPLPVLIPHVAGNGEEGIERQILQMRELIGAEVDLILVQPTDNAALARPLLEANAAGIPVVAYDQYISRGELASYLTSDNFGAGYDDGEVIAARYPDDHVVRLVLVEYPHVSSTVERVDGFLQALEDRGQPFRILDTFEAVEPVGGARAGAAILAAFPEPGSIDVIFTVNDGGGLAVVDALAEAGRDEVLIATIDGDARSIENILAGRLTVVDSAQFCGALGRESMRIGWKVLAGEEVPPLVLLPTFPITAATHERFHGWNEELPEPFTKPWPAKVPNWSWKPITPGWPPEQPEDAEEPPAEGDSPDEPR